MQLRKNIKQSQEKRKDQSKKRKHQSGSNEFNSSNLPSKKVAQANNLFFKTTPLANELQNSPLATRFVKHPLLEKDDSEKHYLTLQERQHFAITWNKQRQIWMGLKGTENFSNQVHLSAATNTYTVDGKYLMIIDYDQSNNLTLYGTKTRKIYFSFNEDIFNKKDKIFVYYDKSTNTLTTYDNQSFTLDLANYFKANLVFGKNYEKAQDFSMNYLEFTNFIKDNNINYQIFDKAPTTLIEHNKQLALGKYVFKHSELSGTPWVYGAGFITFTKGKISEINNDSGHFKPLLHTMLASCMEIVKDQSSKKIYFNDRSKYINLTKVNGHPSYKLSYLAENIDVITEQGEQQDKIWQEQHNHFETAYRFNRPELSVLEPLEKTAYLRQKLADSSSENDSADINDENSCDNYSDLSIDKNQEAKNDNQNSYDSYSESDDNSSAIKRPQQTPLAANTVLAKKNNTLPPPSPSNSRFCLNRNKNSK